MTAGRCVASITLAMVKVLPEPVTPSSTWLRSPFSTALDEVGDGGRLVAGGLVVGLHADGDAAFGFVGRGGRCGVQILPSLNSGLPLSISADSASTVAVTAVPAQRASSSVVSMPETGLRPAAARVFGSVVPPIEVPRAEAAGADTLVGVLFRLLRRDLHLLAVLAGLGGDRGAGLDAGAFGIASSCFTQSATEPDSGSAFERRLRGFLEAIRGGGFFGDLAIRRNMERVRRNVKRAKSTKGKRLLPVSDRIVRWSIPEPAAGVRRCCARRQTAAMPERQYRHAPNRPAQSHGSEPASRPPHCWSRRRCPGRS
jgi:hypothetical protein